MKIIKIGKMNKGADKGEVHQDQWAAWHMFLSRNYKWRVSEDEPRFYIGSDWYTLDGEMMTYPVDISKDYYLFFYKTNDNRLDKEISDSIKAGDYEDFDFDTNLRMVEMVYAEYLRNKSINERAKSLLEALNQVIA